MFKNFVFSESRKLQLRFSAYNFLNHPLTTFNPANGNQTLNLNLNAAGQNTNKQFGYANYLTGSRSIQLALKFFF